jgi:flagellar biosynthesis/type III secretory pathway ATPase
MARFRLGREEASAKPTDTASFRNEDRRKKAIRSATRFGQSSTGISTSRARSPSPTIFQPIDALSSASRTMGRVAQPQHLQAAANLRKQLAKFQEMELLVQIGEYKAGTDPAADEAIRNIGRIRQLLQQPAERLCAFDDAVTALSQAV